MRRPPQPLPLLSIGCLLAAATAGALLAFGFQLGAPFRPLNAVASHFLGIGATETFGFDPAVTLPAIALHLAVALVLTALATTALRTIAIPVELAALLVATLAVASSWIVARERGLGVATVITRGQLVLLGVVTFAALAAGIRLAPRSSGASHVRAPDM